jgi:hypothetical protein
MTKKQSVRVVCSVLFAAVAVAFLTRPTQGEGAVQTVRLNVSPLPSQTDPGPAALIGAESVSGGNSYVWMDTFVEGPGDCRIYFDFKNKDHFHFLDRKGAEVSLGLREAGIEQVFAKGVVTSMEALRLALHG